MIPKQIKIALIVVDLQNDFCRNGALAVAGANDVVAIINDLMPRFDLVVATQDWHPANHGSFAANYPWRKPGQVIELDGLSQILWPIHCVQNTYGAEFVKGLNINKFDKVFRKGTDVNIDSYSVFFDNGHRKATGLGDYLRAEGVTDVYVLGVATDYCVKFTAIDAAALGFTTFLIADACRGVNIQPTDVADAMLEMQPKGVQIIESTTLV